MKLKKLIFLLFILTGIPCLAQQYNEPYRPQYHFSPARGWIGDPDGLIHHKGMFHLYWWGHAVSEDLVHWNELPHPMKGGDGSFSYFSGSVVVDKENTSGFGRNSLLAFYTMHLPGDSLPETQGISVSHDDGREFHFYKDNPVLDINQVFFRDPQVFWYEPDKQWKMVISRPDVQLIYIYESDDLLNWKYCSVFGGLGSLGAFWECPDLFEVAVPNTNIRKWVMLIGRGPNRVQYFVGDFDGNTFTPDKNIADYLQQNIETPEDMPDHALWLDFGNDYYATRTWRNYDDNRNFGDTVYAIGWMGNWDYARFAPTDWGKGFQSIPRTMWLKDTDQGYRIIQKPITQLQQLRYDHFHQDRKEIKKPTTFKGFNPKENVYEMKVELKPVSSNAFGIKLLEGEGRALILHYDTQNAILTLDRTNCTNFTANPEFTKTFATKMKAPISLVDGKLILHIFVDKSSVEIFTNDGEIVLSATTFPSEKQTGVSFFSDGGVTEVVSLDAWRLRSIWK